MPAFDLILGLIALGTLWLAISGRKTVRAGKPLIDLSFARNAVQIGIVMMLVAGVGACSTMQVDTSVGTPLGTRVNNLGLMSNQQNMLIVFGFVGVIGAVLTLAGKLKG